MKKLLLLATLFISSMVFAQVPQGISYQAIAMNGTNPVVSSNVGIRLSVLNLSASGTAVYVESQTKTTNAQGLFNLVIGQGTPSLGTFTGINWGVGSKFLKVEMDNAGGTNYTLVGTTQLLSSPYAMVAGGLVLAPGQGITLTSPNGTPYVLSVSDAGELSLPTTSSSTVYPDNLYLYGSFNGFNPATALLLYSGGQQYEGYKYLTAGTQIKFIAGNTAGATVYGVNGSAEVVPNASAYTVPSNGFYHIRIYGDANTLFLDEFASMTTSVALFNGGDSFYPTPTYNSSTNTFTFIVNGITTGYQMRFGIGNSGENYGDNLSDGTLDYGGTPITGFPGLNGTPKNYKVDLVVNVNGSANYTITQLP